MHPRIKPLVLALALLACFTGVCAAQPQPRGPIQFPVRENDVWVIVGDSITWQNLYPVYLEAFIRARYPKLAFSTVNSGRSGEVYIQGVVRFRDTIAAYNPTLVTLAYGMNDHAKSFPLDQKFLDDPASPPQRLVDMISGKGARVVILTASPVAAPENYSTDGGKLKLTGQNLHAKQLPGGFRSNPIGREFAEKLAILAQRNNCPFVDQMTTLQQVWAMNFGKDRVMAMRRAIAPALETPITADNWAPQSLALTTALKPFLDNPTDFDPMLAPDKMNLAARWKAIKTANTLRAVARTAKWEALRVYLKEWATQVDALNPPCVQVSGFTHSSRPNDLVHPNEAGHLHMAAVLFKQFGADPLVSHVAIDAPAAKVTESKKAVVSDLSYRSETLTFKRLDESLPLPVDPEARPALDVDVQTELGTPRDLFGMSRLMLTVANLPAGNYEVLIDGYTVAAATSEALAQGIDVGLTKTGPIAEQSLKLLEAVRKNSLRVFDKEDAIEAHPRKPIVLGEAQPVEHTWTVRRR